MANTPEAAAKRAQALELRLAGATFPAIAKAIGYASAQSAQRAVNTALKEQQVSGEDATALTELARLDAMLVGLWPKARRGDVAAVDRVLRIEERRAAVVAGDRTATQPAVDAKPKGTGLSDFEQRLAERDGAAPSPRGRRSS